MVIHRVHSKNKTLVSESSVSVLDVRPKRGLYVFWLFFKIDLCSAKSMESSRRDLLNDVAEQGSCHKRQKPRAPTSQAPIRNRQTRKVANAKSLNRNTNLA